MPRYVCRKSSLPCWARFSCCRARCFGKDLHSRHKVVDWIRLTVAYDARAIETTSIINDSAQKSGQVRLWWWWDELPRVEQRHQHQVQHLWGLCGSAPAIHRRPTPNTMEMAPVMMAVRCALAVSASTGLAASATRSAASGSAGAASCSHGVHYALFDTSPHCSHLALLCRVPQHGAGWCLEWR